uniref:Uncharacterized protein n=1 Tax=Plectus sambesii TaxID=2011161 RepID=A0A914XAF7_9BILA
MATTLQVSQDESDAFTPVMGNCEGTTGWNWERGQARPSSSTQPQSQAESTAALDLSTTNTTSSRSGSSREESDFAIPLLSSAGEGHRASIASSVTSSTKHQRSSMASKNVTASLPPTPPSSTSTSGRRPLPFGIGRRYSPPSPEEAQEDIYAHIQSLLTPSACPSPVMSGSRRFLFPTTKYDRSGEMTAASWRSHGGRTAPPSAIVPSPHWARRRSASTNLRVPSGLLALSPWASCRLSFSFH